MSEAPRIGLVMGSNSDWDVMQHAADMLKKFGVPFEARVVSAHRTPDLLFEYAGRARERGIACIIAGAGGAAHLPGMLQDFLARSSIFAAPVYRQEFCGCQKGPVVCGNFALSGPDTGQIGNNVGCRLKPNWRRVLFIQH